MVVRWALAVVLSTAALPAAALSTSPLHEIAPGPHLADVCGNVVVHANAAIAGALHDDQALARALVRLRGADFDAFGAARKSALLDIARAANDVSETSERGKSETKRLRDFIERPAGLDRRTELLGFTEALDAAFERQHKAAGDLSAFLLSLEYRDLRDAARQPADAPSLGEVSENDAYHGTGRVPTALSTPTSALDRASGSGATLLARTQAADLDPGLAAIAGDEARAQGYSEAAVGGC